MYLHYLTTVYLWNYVYVTLSNLQPCVGIKWMDGWKLHLINAEIQPDELISYP